MSVHNFNDFIVSLQTDEYHIGTKRHHAVPKTEENPFGWETDEFKAGNRFLAREHPINNLDDVAAVVDSLRSDDPRMFLVNGALTDEGRKMLRGIPRWKRKYDEMSAPDVMGALKQTLEPATFKERASHIVFVDLDDVDTFPGMDIANDPVAAVDYAIRKHMPATFHDIRTFWQLSSSAGFYPKLSVHLFFWSDIPVTNPHVKDVLAPYKPKVCHAPYNAVQPFYIADPVVENGVDPLQGRRTGWREGKRGELVLPPPKARPEASHEAYRAGDAPKHVDIESAFAVMGRGEGGEGFHQPIRDILWLYVSVARTPCPV